MLNKKQRALSGLLALLLAVSALLSGMTGISAKEGEAFTEENYLIDFSGYNFVEGTGANGNVVKSESGKWSLVGDSSAEGGKYLHFERRAVKAGENWKANYHFMANPTGAYNGATKAGAVRLTENTGYSLKIKYKIENLDTAYDLDLYVGCTQGVYSPNSVDSQNIVDAASGLGNTDGWVEKEYRFVTPAVYKGSVNNLFIGFYPTKAGTADFPSNDLFSYSVSVDSVEISRLAEARLNKVGKSGVSDTEKIYGKVGEKIEFPDTGTVIYESYDSSTGALSDAVNTADRTFKRFAFEDFYYKDNTFEKESYSIDFSRYNFVEGTGADGNVVKSESGKWSLVSDSDAEGGKYLHFERNAVKNGENWRPYYQFTANPTGAYNAATSAGAVRLAENTRYTVKIKYKIENLDEAYDLDLYANCTKGVYSPNSFQTNNFDIASGLGNTDGWVEKQYSFVTPSSYEGNRNNLLIGFYPTKAGTAAFPTNDLFSYSLSIDYIKIDRATSVVFMSGDETVNTLYGAPGDILSDFPAAQRNGYRFAGWFKDAACSQAAEPITLTNKEVSATLYAGWTALASSAVITDGEYPDWRDNAEIYSGFTSENIGGESCFGYNASGKEAYMRLYSGSDPLIIADKGVYMLTVRYKSESNADIGFAASAADKFNAADKRVQISREIKPSDEWQTAVLTFTADIKENADALYFTLTSSGGRFLTDRITLSVNSSIKLETNGGAAIADLKGTPGEKALLPEPIFGGHTFSGWYKDSALKIPATSVKFPTDTESITLYAAWDKAEADAVVDFENVPYENGKWTNPQFSYNSATMSFINGDAFSGEKFLRFGYSPAGGDYNKASQSFAMYKNGGAVRVEAGATYVLSFWYRAGGGDTDIRITAQTCTANNFYANAQNYANAGYTVRASEADGEWHEGTIVFTADPKKDSKGNDANALFVRINPLADKAAALDLDYISLTRLGEDTAVISLVIDSSKTQFTAVKKGEKITMPTPERENYIFRGWYSDSLFKNQITGEYTAKETTELYAKWSLKAAFNDFEEYPQGWINNIGSDGLNLRYGNSHMSVSEKEHYSGKYSLNFSYNGSQSEKTSMAQLYNLGDIFVAGDTPLILDNGRIYTATLRYKVNSAVGNANIDLALAGRNNYYANRTRINFLTVSSADVGKGWQTAMICFTASVKKEKADALYLAFTANGNSDIYIDDFSVELLENKTYIKFDADNNTQPQYSVGEAGSAVKYPAAPARRGYSFAGWYTDKSYSEPFTGKYHGSAPLTVYAKWVLGDSVVISFEDENQRNLKANQYDTTEISDEQASDGKYSLKLNKAGNDRMNASMLLLYDNQPVTVENGATYVLTYDYYVVQNTGKKSGQTTPLPNVRFAKASNVWSGYAVPKNNWSINLEEETGRWFTGSVMFTAELKEPEGNALYFTVNYSENFVGYFDNLRLVRVNKGNGESAVNLNPCGADDLGSSKLVYTGKPNGQIKLPTDLKKEGFTFIGWYEDSKLKKRIESEYYTILQSDTTLYAGFARPELKQDFESFSEIFSPQAYRYADMDYELYDARISGNSRENVHGGNYSIHRKGNDFHTACFQILPETSEATKRLIPGLIYKMTMWVKLESKKQDTGAVKIACSQSAYYAWAIDGDWYNVAAIKDLKEGEWTELSFTFYATSCYLSVQTPGNVSMYFDDVTLELLYGAKTADCSQSVKIEEYTPEISAADASALSGEINASLIKEVRASKASLPVAAVAASAAAIAVIASIAVTAVILGKKRREGKKK